MKKLLYLFIFISSLSFAQDGGLKTLIATGPANAYVISEALPATYNQKERFQIIFPVSNTGASTINRAGLGLKDIRKNDGSALSSGDITAGNPYFFSYSSANGYYVCETCGGGGGVSGSGTTNELAYWTSGSALGTLPVATYPSLTELATLKGINTGSSIQSQLNSISNYSSTPPEIIYASITGQTMKNRVLSVSYLFRDIDGTAEGTSTFQWIRADDASGTGVADIVSAISSTYTLVTGDIGKYIACKITPVNATPEAGDEFTTTYVGAVDDVYYPADNANTIVSYGIKKMASAYAGNCIQVQNISAGATQNIGFDANGDIDWAAVSSFSGGSNTTLKIWYDQSGNGFNMLFTAFADQPIVNPNDKRIEWGTGNDGFVTHNALMNIGTGDFSFFMEATQKILKDMTFTYFEKKTSFSANNLQFYSPIGYGLLMYTGNAGSNQISAIYATPERRNVSAGYRNATTKFLNTDNVIKSASETATDLTNTNNIKFNTGDGGDGQWWMWSFSLYKQNYGSDYLKYKKFVSPN